MLGWPKAGDVQGTSEGPERASMTRYWVVGGEYSDTHFARMAAGQKEQWIGPFEDYQDAMAEWQRRARSSVDRRNVRYRIETFDPEHPPCSD
jgi:SLT domain-containing protein